MNWDFYIQLPLKNEEIYFKFDTNTYYNFTDFLILYLACVFINFAYAEKALGPRIKEKKEKY